MKNLFFILCVVLLASCTTKQSTLQVVETGEKVVMYNDVYSVGDTVILEQIVDPVGELSFELDNNWISFKERYKYLDQTGYYKAVVIQ